MAVKVSIQTIAGCSTYRLVGQRSGLDDDDASLSGSNLEDDDGVRKKPHRLDVQHVRDQNGEIPVPSEVSSRSARMRATHTWTWASRISSFDSLSAHASLVVVTPRTPSNSPPKMSCSTNNFSPPESSRPGSLQTCTLRSETA